MKKLSVILAALVLSVSTIHANGVYNFFSHRFVEFKLSSDVSATTNLFPVKNIFTDELVIDLRQIADDMPSYGFKNTVSTTEVFNFKVDIPHAIIFGASAGLTGTEGLNISKDLFDFLGYGNELNQTIQVGVNAYSDIFAYIQPTLGWNFHNISFTVSPTMFTTVLHATTDNSYIKVENTEDGTFNIEALARLAMYSNIPISKDSLNTTTLLNYLPNFGSDAGYDISGHVDWNAFRYLTFNFDTRIPIVPSKLNCLTMAQAQANYSLKLTDYMKKTASDSDDSDSSENSLGSYSYSLGSTEDCEAYTVNRPMKFFTGVTFSPFLDIMKYYGGVGLAFEHPFSEIAEERSMYVEYLLGLQLSCFNILKLDLSTQYTDRVFIQKAQLALNLRAIEIAAGIASQSASFKQSLMGAGLGVYVTACIGF